MSTPGATSPATPGASTAASSSTPCCRVWSTARSGPPRYPTPSSSPAEDQGYSGYLMARALTEPSRTAIASEQVMDVAQMASWQCLYRRPEPQGHGALRP